MILATKTLSHKDIRLFQKMEKRTQEILVFTDDQGHEASWFIVEGNDQAYPRSQGPGKGGLYLGEMGAEVGFTVASHGKGASVYESS